MRIKEMIGKGRRFFTMKKDIACMEWVDFTASSMEDVKAWEGIYDKPIVIKEKEYVFRKKNMALLEMPEDFENYKKGKPMQAFRTNYNKGKKKGFTCRLFCGLDYFEQIMEINLSKDERAGHAMSGIYTDRGKVRAFLGTNPVMFGTFTSEGKLIAYLHLLNGGGILALNKIIGHGEYLADGVMYFMLGELIRQIPDIYPHKRVSYIMYGSWYGGVASAGIKYYKTLCGFCGYNIRYHVSGRKNIE